MTKSTFPVIRSSFRDGRLRIEVREPEIRAEVHRFFAHGMVAVFSNPLLAAIMSGKSDIFRGLIGSIGPAMINRLVGTAFDQVARMQEAGLIRSDISVHTVAFLLGAHCPKGHRERLSQIGSLKSNGE